MMHGYVERDVDVSGVSGTGRVAEFTLSSDGRCVVFWEYGHSYFDSLDFAIQTHGHNGNTRFVIVDD